MSADAAELRATVSPSPADATDGVAERLRGRRTVRHVGRIVRALGTSLRVSGLPARIGERCEIVDRDGAAPVLAEVVGLEGGDAILVPLAGLAGISAGAEVRALGDAGSVRVSDALLGRVLDGFGRPLDGAPAPRAADGRETVASVRADPPGPLARARIDAPVVTGVRAIDALMTVGRGQRVGVFAPAGAGKSTLLGMLAGGADADVIVVGLVGERGREVREFLEDVLGERARARSVVVVATSDRPSMERVAAAQTATAVADGFRRRGRSVLLLVDSVTRYARALREVGLAVGEPPARQGFPPSVFAELPRLFERAGNDEHGSITAFYTVLTDDDDGLDPIAEETRSILDGHFVLSRRVAETGRYPAIDVPASLSRLFSQLAPPGQRAAAQRLRSLLAKYRDVEFLIQVGEYERGADALADEAVRLHAPIERFLAQATDAPAAFDESVAALLALAGEPAPSPAFGR